jgi:hypothetical protein
MHLPLYLGAFIIIVVIAFSFVFLFGRKKYTYTVLYDEGIKNENNGHFSAALENYNNALAEVEKYKFHEKMKQQLIQKIKVIKSTIEYESH